MSSCPNNSACRAPFCPCVTKKHMALSAKLEQSYAPRGCQLNGHPEYRNILFELRDLHALKSGGYGTGDDPFANFTAVAAVSGEPRYLYPVLRSIEKLTRVMSLHGQGRVGELEEEFLDVASLLVCAAAMLREDRADSDAA